MSSFPLEVWFSNIKQIKIYDELSRHVAPEMDRSILGADDEITRHNIFLVNFLHEYILD